MTKDNRHRILLVDDDIDYLTTMRLALSGAGYEVATAETIAQAKQELEQAPPDLAILDLMMDEPDAGFVLCHHVKQVCPQTPVIVVSAVTSETGIEFGTSSAGDRSWIKADTWLAKPVRFEQLQGEISRLLAVHS